jgi:hypothetical protein
MNKRLKKNFGTFFSSTSTILPFSGSHEAAWLQAFVTSFEAICRMSSERRSSADIHEAIHTFTARLSAGSLTGQQAVAVTSSGSGISRPKMHPCSGLIRTHGPSADARPRWAIVVLAGCGGLPCGVLGLLGAQRQTLTSRGLSETTKLRRVTSLLHPHRHSNASGYEPSMLCSGPSTGSPRQCLSPRCSLVSSQAFSAVDHQKSLARQVTARW